MEALFGLPVWALGAIAFTVTETSALVHKIVTKYSVVFFTAGKT